MYFSSHKKRVASFHGKNSGYSLVETVLYMALFVTLSTVLISSLFGMTRAYTQARVNNDLLDSAHVSMERMTREIRGATSLDTGVSVFATNPGILKLNTTDASLTPKTVQFAVASGVLELTDSTDGTPTALTGSKISVDSLIFRNITTTEGSAVRIEMTLTSTRTPAHKTISLFDTVTLRGAY